MLSITIDWLAVTFKNYYDEQGELRNGTHDFIGTYASFSPMQTATPRFGYSDATMDNNGTIVQWNPDRSEMGHHVILAGSALRNIFSNTTIQPRTLLRACIDAGGSISRLDLAKDATDEEIDLQAIYKSLEQGHNRGLTRKHAIIASNDGGLTIYVGSRQSERFIRIYNKAAESKLSDQLWFRFELETKGVVARSLGTRLASDMDWQQSFDALAKGMVNLPNSLDFQKFFTMGVVPIGLPKLERRTDREVWIETQVIGAVARHYIDNPNSEAVTRLIETLNLIDRQRKI